MKTHEKILLDELYNLMGTDDPDAILKVIKNREVIGFIDEIFFSTDLTETDPMTKQEYSEFVSSVLEEIKELVHQKNHDYSDGDDPFKNFRMSETVGVDPLVGLWIRMEDKFQRIRAFLNRGDLAVPNESVADAFLDTIGYSLLALGMIEEQARNDDNL